MSQLVLEGTCEEIVSHSDELANEKVRLTILDPESSLDPDEYAETVMAIRTGIESFNRGEGKPAREALEELRQKHGRSS